MVNIKDQSFRMVLRVRGCAWTRKVIFLKKEKSFSKSPPCVPRAAAAAPRSRFSLILQPGWTQNSRQNTSEHHRAPTTSASIFHQTFILFRNLRWGFISQKTVGAGGTASAEVRSAVDGLLRQRAPLPRSNHPWVSSSLHKKGVFGRFCEKIVSSFKRTT